MVFVANVGDAKAVLARLPAKQLPTEGVSADHTAKPGDGIPMEAKKEERPKAVIVTREHKAIFPEERARVEKAGGFVANGRLQGRLEVSRAFGDRQFKKVGVSAAPDVHAFKITERERFMVLGCDGFWGVFGPSDAVEFADKLLQEGLSVEVVSKRLVREAVRERRCKDNCTALTIVFSR
ncbi:hypothetical protein CBR_g17858 [Chara braunii]|uniref:PPM-type phosphatase domain-containing protein n=1 Tax=Chara braunii TaxID=69332 RepID=A0A388KVQ5_CHABU|nr:hypothetical protein CBR_g17858 [Chara braunii]|eukprot:GBG74145.1 hypothetical protein CBR_g17858 [Chara braunii]